MKLAAVRKVAMALPEVTEEPHHEYGSFRVKGKIFITMPPDGEHIHVFVSPENRDALLASFPEFTGKLLWGGKVVGVRVALANAKPKAVEAMVVQAWHDKAPKSLHARRA